MKRTKRKYTRKPKFDALGLISSPTKGESSAILPPDKDALWDDRAGESVMDTVKEFSFNDLPLSIKTQVENTIKMRERLGLPDDYKERKALAIKYFRGDRPR